MTKRNPVLLEAHNIQKSFAANGGILKQIFKQNLNSSQILKGVSLKLQAGEILGIVGESGCGKTTLAKILLGLIKPSCGKISIFGIDITNGNKIDIRPVRRFARMIFQNPASVLNPYMKVGDILQEILKHHTSQNEKERLEKINRCLSELGLPQDYTEKYSHELSGGEKKRITIARAILLDTKLIIADEPFFGLDISLQIELINYFRQYREKNNTAFVIISHNIQLIKILCDRIMVMSDGKIVEEGLKDIFTLQWAKHDYTKRLLASEISLNHFSN